MKYIYRNSAIEYLFSKDDCIFSNYGNFMPINDEKINTVIYFNFLPFEYNIEILIDWIENYKQSIIKNVELNQEKKFIVVKLKNFHYKSVNLSDNTLQKNIDNFNAEISEITNIYTIDLNDFDKKDLIDYKFYYTYNAIINPFYKEEFMKWFENQLSSVFVPAKKCLVLDLDNTLWGGILAEDGIENLKISGTYPGNAYCDFQKLILYIKQNGVILCIASKNNENDVKDCFLKREDLILKYDDFVIKKISWQDKNKSICEISKELNIGLDSIVFIDDSPQERDLIKTFCPQVEVLDFPESPYLLTKFYSDEFKRLFSKKKITKEDLSKTELYNKKLKADLEKNLYDSEEEYIKKLNIKVTYQEISDYNIDRIVELINKTNQFNTNPVRYSFEQISQMRKIYNISAISVEDKFGDLGIVGCAIVKKEKNTAVIESFMLSCRILGRKIEHTYFDFIKTHLKDTGVKEIIGLINKTPKNIPVQNFYKECGFKLLEKESTKELYSLTI